MTNPHLARFAVLALAFITSVASAQSFNIDIGLDGGPPDTYAAAGRAGHWTSVPATQGVTVFDLVDIDGNTSSASFIQIGGTETLSLEDAAVTGDDAILMNDTLITHTTVENCMFFSNVLPGRYAVLVYARMPGEPDVLAVTNVDQEPGNPHLLVGGPWPGGHVEGISFSRHIADVAATGAQAGRLGLHSGVPSGGNFGIGAALNGLQIIKLSEADFDNNGVVEGTDVDLLVAEIVAGTNDPTFDLNGDGNVTLEDVTDQVNGWLRLAGEENLGPGRSYLPGDITLDGVTDGRDFIEWNNNKFTDTGLWSLGDLDANGVTDGRDFVIWNASKFMSSDVVVAIPEPGLAVWSMTLVLLAVASVRRRARA